MSLVLPDDVLRATRMSEAELAQEIAVLLFQSERSWPWDRRAGWRAWID
jgi:predicted HTH domain antitoxin